MENLKLPLGIHSKSTGNMILDNDGSMVATTHCSLEVALGSLNLKREIECKRANFIVRACNSHDEVVGILKNISLNLRGFEGLTLSQSTYKLGIIESLVNQALTTAGE